MWPSIRPRDIVFIQRADINRIFPGQIVAFARENRVIIHRVLSKTQKLRGDTPELCLITKGDALDGADFPVAREEFLGRVTRIHRGRRHIDLESTTRQAFGRIAASISPWSRLLFGSVRRLGIA